MSPSSISISVRCAVGHYASRRLWAPSIMVNVLGEHVVPLKKVIMNYPDWSIHLYGKAEAKEKRKMGHVTIMTDDIEKTLTRNRFDRHLVLTSKY